MIAATGGRLGNAPKRNRAAIGATAAWCFITYSLKGITRQNIFTWMSTKKVYLPPPLLAFSAGTGNTIREEKQMRRS